MAWHYFVQGQGSKNLPGYPEGLKLHMSVTVDHKGKNKKIYTRNIGREKMKKMKRRERERGKRESV